MMLLLLREVYKTYLKVLEVADACSTSVVTPYLLTAEKNLLALSTYSDCTDGMLYRLPLLFDVDEDLVLYVRYVLLIGF